MPKSKLDKPGPTCAVFMFCFVDTMFRDYRFDQCAVGLTPTTQLYVDMVTPGLGVALGGCGYAAKSSDEIGRMAAR